MAARFTGRAGAIKVEDGDDFDPQTGWSYFEIWRGPKPAILAKAADFRASGWKVRRQKWTGAFYQIQATYGSIPGEGGGSESEVPVDRYRIGTEFVQQDLKDNPLLIALAGSEADLALLIRDIDKALADGISLEEAIAQGLPFADAIYRPVFNLRARGQMAYELKRPILTRIRSVTTSYPRQFVMTASPAIYKTAALIRVFGIPANVVARLPADPAAKPSNTEWAWFWKQQDSDIISTTNRAQEMDSWHFAHWSTATYTLVST
jgi:hypothetical protein